ncbi:unnamed protein product [Menidia menidia]|uniref:(Atlantic silverside) hypothetical protein n=1 Tax=Menidia menidia TaxID=238744 RepID=A0A8S4BV66_9TELE|nr:unnamed protein product [Menidia menidia]
MEQRTSLYLPVSARSLRRPPASCCQVCFVPQQAGGSPSRGKQRHSRRPRGWEATGSASETGAHLSPSLWDLSGGGQGQGNVEGEVFTGHAYRSAVIIV